MANLDIDIYLRTIFGPIEIDIRHWRSMALRLNFQSDLKRARLEHIKDYVARVLKADAGENGLLINEFRALVSKPMLALDHFEFLLDYKEPMLISRMISSGLFDENLVRAILNKVQALDVKLCYLVDNSKFGIEIVARWLSNLELELHLLSEFKSDLKWFNSHKKLEVASREFNIKIGAALITKREIETYLFSQYVSMDEKRKVIKRIKANYHSLMHRDKSDKKQINVYVDLKIAENIEAIYQENNMKASDLISFIFRSKHLGKVRELMVELKRDDA